MAQEAGTSNRTDLAFHVIDECTTDAFAGEKQSLRWTMPAIQQLLSLCKLHKDKFNSTKWKKKQVWELVVQGMEECGYHMTSVQVEGKWKTMAKNVKQYRDKHSCSDASKMIPFQAEVLEIMGDVSSKHKGKSSESDTSDDEQQLLQSLLPGLSSSLRKRKNSASDLADDYEEPAWFTDYRQEVQSRHECKMARQDRMLEVLKKLADKLGKRQT